MYFRVTNVIMLVTEIFIVHLYFVSSFTIKSIGLQHGYFSFDILFIYIHILHVDTFHKMTSGYSDRDGCTNVSFLSCES